MLRVQHGAQHLLHVLLRQLMLKLRMVLLRGAHRGP